MELWKLSGTFLWATGMVHCTVGMAWYFIQFRFYWDSFVNIANDGFINAIGSSPERHALLFFLLSGFFLIVLGHLCSWIIQIRDAPLPRFLGWYILSCGLVGGLLQPLGGFGLLIPQGLIILFPRNMRPNEAYI